ncbi:hypothetical protein Y032_0499g2554 [Ancylostoma ceylanicum]|uniref:Uncharacterized protein n=1 Tax=Ancylostoma ceylanicum TaxID=53326 RepID=A0A016WTS1_9BILA|nr:hypothetical protein Y032_0499g2554 [Ancylostoma ceylanicum]
MYVYAYPHTLRGVSTTGAFENHLQDLYFLEEFAPHSVIFQSRHSRLLPFPGNLHALASNTSKSKRGHRSRLRNGVDGGNVRYFGKCYCCLFVMREG